MVEQSDPYNTYYVSTSLFSPRGPSIFLLDALEYYIDSCNTFPTLLQLTSVSAARSSSSSEMVSDVFFCDSVKEIEEISAVTTLDHGSKSTWCARCHNY